MATLKLPQTQIVFADRPYPPKAIDSLFPLIKNRSGSPSLILTAQRATHRLMLFILETRPYAAGRLTDDRFEALTLQDYFKDLAEADPPTITLSETNPVLFKCLLVVTQKIPTTAGTTDLVNVEGLLNRLKTSKQEAVVSLRHADDLNLFYFAKGKLYEAYFADPASISKDSTPEDQFLEYAYTAASASPVAVQAYEDVRVGPAEDQELPWEESPEGIVGYFLKPRPELIFLSGESSVEKKTIRKRVFTLGRNPDSDLPIHDIQASRDHATIREAGGTFILEDKMSRNGTFVDNQKITTITLSDGNEIRIGRTRILFMEKPKEPGESASGGERGTGELLETTMLKMDEAVLQQAAAAIQPTQQKLSLKILNGPQQEMVIPLTGKLFIGRTKADINTNDPKVSRHHASIEEKADGYHFTDLNSTNGSFINDQPVQTKILAPGDIIRVGDTMLSVTEGESVP